MIIPNIREMHVLLGATSIHTPPQQDVLPQNTCDLPLSVDVALVRNSMASARGIWCFGVNAAQPLREDKKETSIEILARIRDLEEKALTIEAAIYVTLARAYFHEGHYDLVVRSLEKALRANPNSYDLAKIGRYYRKIGSYDLAIHTLDKAVSEGHNNSLPYLERGITYASRGYKLEARRDFYEALRFYPFSHRAHFELGLLNYKYFNAQDAVGCFTKALNHAKTPQPTYFYHRALALYKLGRLDAAYRDLSKAIQEDPQNIDYYKERGMVSEEIGSVEAAAQDYERAIEIADTPDFETIANRGRTLFYMGQLDEALLHIEASLALKIEGNFEALKYRGLVLHEMGRNAEAEADLSFALTIDPNDDEIPEVLSEIRGCK